MARSNFHQLWDAAKIFEPEHDGPGRVLKVNYPYCPKCDGEIEHATACFHIGKEVHAMIKGGESMRG